MQVENFSAYDCAQQLIAILQQNNNDMRACANELLPICAKFCSQPDLKQRGVPRVGNHQDESAWLYYDGNLSIMTARVLSNVRTPVHDHATQEIVFVYDGAYHFTEYARVDDGSQPGRAKLKIRSDRVMHAGHSALVAPPDDIHGYKALTDDTWIVVFVMGHFAKVRKYYDPEKETYVERAETEWRLDGKKSL